MSCSAALSFYVLQKFTIPRGVYLIAINPVHHKFRQQCLGLWLCNSREAERLVDRGIGLPVARNARWFRAVVELAGVFQPASAHMLYETAVDLFRRATTFTPVEDKFGAHRLGENNIDAGLRQNVQRVLTRYPVPTEGRRYTDFKRL